MFFNSKYWRHQCAWLETYNFFQFFVFDQPSWHGLLMKLYRSRQNYGRNFTIIVQLEKYPMWICCTWDVGVCLPRSQLQVIMTSTYKLPEYFFNFSAFPEREHFYIDTRYFSRCKTIHPSEPSKTTTRDRHLAVTFILYYMNDARFSFADFQSMGAF